VPAALASGTHDMGYADLNPAIRFLAQNPDSGLVAVAILHDRSPLCAIVRADGPVRTPKDLRASGWRRRISTPGGSFSRPSPRRRGWMRRRCSSSASRPQLREPMLVRREADGVTASSPPRAGAEGHRASIIRSSG
jgi:NitT/TauT family transport system substrate-binding protein